MLKPQEKITYQETFEKMSEAEAASDFYRLYYYGIPLWVYPREKAANFLNGLSGAPKEAMAFIKIKPVKIIGRIIHFFIHAHSLFGNTVIIFTNERHLQWSAKDNRYYNQFAELVLEKTRHKKALVFEFPTAMTTKYSQVAYQRYLPLDVVIALKTMFSWCYIFFYPRIKKEFYSKLVGAGIWQSEDIKKILTFTAFQAYSITWYGLFLKLVKWLNPKADLIYSCMGAYDKFPGVIEIQHGMIDDLNLQFIFPKTPSIKSYLHDKKIVVFSDKIKNLLLNNGYSDENIEVTPNPKVYFYFLKNMEESFLEESLKEKEMVIIGGHGGIIKEKIKDFVFTIEKNKEIFKDWNISLVLHPSEKNIYKDLKLAKVNVYENHQVSLWEKIQKALCVAGVYSTVLEEAMFFGCFEIIIEVEELQDQKKGVEWLVGDYPYTASVLPDNFAQWFGNNQQHIANHTKVKMEMMKKNYDYFKDYQKNYAEKN